MHVGIYVYFADAQNIDVTDNVPELICENYKIWRERVLFHLGYIDIDYAIHKDEHLKLLILALQLKLLFMNVGNDLIFLV